MLRSRLDESACFRMLNESTSDPKEISVTIQDVEGESMKCIKTERDDPSWAAQEGQKLFTASTSI